MNTWLYVPTITRNLKIISSTFVLVCLLFSCSTNKKPESVMTINPNSLKSSPEDLAFWMMFAVSQNGCAKSHPAYSFGEFSCAFKFASLLLDDNKALSAEKKTKSTFQKDVKAVFNAGFIDEYLFFEYRQSNWFVAPNLKSKEYETWKSINLVNHNIGDPSSVTMTRETPASPPEVKELKLSNSFIKSVGNLTYETQRKYESASLGLSLRYKMKDVPNGWLDFYIYPNLRSTKSNSLEKVLADEATNAKTAIIYQAQQDKIEHMDIIEETFNDDLTFLTGIYEIKYDNTSFANELYISGNEKYFLKARV
ncbi:MAG: hypothetical protein KUG78_02210, partial [Kangiellaceae bacterium]|nr:hypothetical protein [Kangiellaceae bacterium]